MTVPIHYFMDKRWESTHDRGAAVDHTERPG